MLKNKVSKLKLEKHIFPKPVYEESEKRKYYIKNDFFIYLLTMKLIQWQLKSLWVMVYP